MAVNSCYEVKTIQAHGFWVIRQFGFILGQKLRERYTLDVSDSFEVRTHSNYSKR